MKKMADTHNCYFLRLHVEDRCGVLAEMTAVFAKYHVSVAQIIQKETKAGESAEVVVITGKVREGDFRTAMEELSGRSLYIRFPVCSAYMENKKDKNKNQEFFRENP